MTVSKTAGARFYIGPVVNPDDIEDMSDEDALSFFDAIPTVEWVEVGEIESFGDLGDNAETASFASVKDRRQRKFKTVHDAGTMSIVCGRDPLDVGQDVMIDAEKTDWNYAFKLIYADSQEPGQPDSIDYFAGTVLSRPVNLGGVGDLTKITFAVGVNTMIVPAVRAVGDFPWTSPDTVADIEFAPSPAFYSGSLGVITAAQAITTVRSSADNLAFDSEGQLVSFAANTPRITDLGLAAEISGSCRIDFNVDLTNAAWTKTNATIAADLPSPLAVGAPAGCSITATANGDASVTSTLAPLGGGNDESLPHAMFFKPVGMVYNDAVELTQDGFVVVTDIRSQLVEGRWVQIGGVSQPVTLDDNVFGVRMKNALIGNKIGFAMGNIERGYTMTTPIYTPGIATVNRNTETTTLNLANFPELWNLRRFTIFVVCRPRLKPLPGITDPDHPRNGGTCLEINNPYDIHATSTESSIAPFGGLDEGSVITVGGTVGGNWAEGLPTTWGSPVGLKLAAGTGAGSRTDILEQLTGTPGGAGTYRVFSDVYPDGQTAPRSGAGTIVLDARSKTAQGLAINWAQKPDDVDIPGRTRMGLTVTAEPGMIDFGNDPMTEDVEFGAVNAMGFTIDLDAKAGWVALDGDTEPLSPVQFTHAPVFTSDIVVNLGSQYPSGGSTNGEIIRVIIDGVLYSQEDIAATTIGLQAKYAAEV
jgi:hypothetical protein